MNVVLWFLACGTALALAAVALVLLWLRGRPYRNSFRIPLRRDDSFTSRGYHRTIPVSIESGSFEMPEGVQGRGQTALLSLSTESTPLGRFVDPFIELWHEGEGVRYRQYFERGGAGKRYLNLSPLFQDGRNAPVTRIHLRGSSLRWKRGAILALFEPPPIRGAEILVLAPHPDDAEIAAFGMYAGRRSWVVTVTAGDGGSANFSAVVPHRAYEAGWGALLRGFDSLTIPLLGDVPSERCLNLVYPDGKLQSMYEHATRPVRLVCEDAVPRRTLRSRNPVPEFRGGAPACTWEGLVEELRQLLEKTNPDIVVCPHPLVDGHHDHVFTTVALEKAIHLVARKPPSFFFYVVHRRDVSLYPLGCMAGLVSPPPWTDEEWIADSIYSHPLSPDVQCKKYFAVEAGHDLRTYDTGEPRTFAQVLTTVRREILALVSGTGLSPASFLRRSPRPNEIYCVASQSSLSELVQRALSRYPSTGD